MAEEGSTITESSNVQYQQDPSLIMFQLDPADIIEQLEHNLAGEIWDAIKRKYVSRGERIVNDKGIKAFVGVVASKVNRAVILSNLTEDDVYRIAREVRSSVADLIFLRYGEFEIKKHNFDVVVQMIDHLVFCTLKRAMNEGERRFLGRTQSRQEKVIERKGGRGGSWFPFFGRKSD